MSKHRYTRSSFLLLALSSLALMLAACTGVGGSETAGSGPVTSPATGKPWVYKPQEQVLAESAPSPLADVYGGNTLPPLSPQGAISESLMNNGQQSYGPGIPQDGSQVQEQAAALEASNPDLPAVKVALLVPLTGQNADLGQAMLNASQLALFDVGHAKFQIVPRDTKDSPQDAARAAQEAIDDGAQLILGPVFADSVRSVKDVASRRGINVVAFSTDWTLADSRTFLMGFLPFGQVNRVVSYAAMQGLTNIGVLAPDTLYGNATMQAYRDAASRSGVTTVDTKTFNPSDRKLDEVVKRFAHFDQRKQIVNGQEQTGPAPYDAIFLPVSGDEAKTLSNLATQYGMPTESVRRLGTGLWEDSALRNDKNLRGAWFAAPSPKARRDFESRYSEMYGQSAPRLATLAYDATALAAILAQSGLQATGRPAFDAASITNPNGFIGIDGIFRFRKDGLVERGLAVLEIKNGQIAVVEEAPQTFQAYGSF